MTPDDNRAFALKVPADEAALRDERRRDQGDVRELQAEPRVRKATAATGSGGKSRERRAGSQLVTPAPRARGGRARPRPSRRRARTGDPRADRAAADLAAAADRAAVEPRRRPSRADRAHASEEEDRARREADAAGPLPLPDLDQLRQPTARATVD